MLAILGPFLSRIVAAMNNPMRGVLAMVVAVAAFSLMDAVLKLFAARYPALQVTAIRALASLPFVLLPLWHGGRLAELRPRRPGLHLLRGLIGVVMLAGFVFALRESSLTAVYSVYMGAPLLIAVLAAWWLKERVDRIRWLAIVAGFVGVLIILQPRADGLSLLAGLAAFVSALCYALAVIIGRVLTRAEHSSAIVFSYLLIMCVVAAAFALPAWVAVRLEHYPLIVAVGGLGAVGQFYITEAFRQAPASVVAPIEYTALLWGIGIDFLAWSVLPNLTMLGGASLVVAAGILVTWRERSSPA